MQSKQNSSEKSANGFQQVWNRLSASVTGSRDYAAVAYRRNPDSIHDEALILIWLVLIASLVFTGGYGVYFHYEIFSNAFNAWSVLSGVISGAIFILGEIMKVGLGLLLLRSIFTGHWVKDLQTIGITCGLLIITTGAFIWSYDISVKSTGQINEAVKVSELRSGIIYDPAAYTAPLDSQIASLDKDIKRLAKMKVASGEISWPAQKAIAKAQETKSKLMSQRQAAETRYQAQQDSTSTASLLIIRQAAKQLGDYGGMAEITCIVCLFIIALIESKAYKKFKDEKPVDTAPTAHDPQPTTHSPQPTAHDPRPTKQDLTDAVGQAIKQYFTQNKPVEVTGFRQAPTNPVAPPPLLTAENRGAVVATTSHSPQPTTHNPRVHVASTVEFVEDVERAVIEQLDRFGKYFPSKWNARGKGGGRPETIAFNLANCIEVVDELMKQGGISPATQSRVERCRKAYQEEVLPNLPKA